jgi:hypothetical protein
MDGYTIFDHAQFGHLPGENNTKSTRRYTYAETLAMEKRGYTFIECSRITDPQPMFVIASYDPPQTCTVPSSDFISNVRW